jgi:hypothetical protein
VMRHRGETGQKRTEGKQNKTLSYHSFQHLTAKIIAPQRRQNATTPG